jgi:hypothetical protein
MVAAKFFRREGAWKERYKRIKNILEREIEVARNAERCFAS